MKENIEEKTAESIYRCHYVFIYFLHTFLAKSHACDATNKNHVLQSTFIVYYVYIIIKILFHVRCKDLMAIETFTENSAKSFSKQYEYKEYIS